MEVQTCGKTFNVETIIARKLAGVPLTFGEQEALETAAKSTRASEPVTRGPVTPAVVVLKTAAGPVRVDVAKANTRVQDFAWEQIQKLGEAERMKDRTISRERANARAMESPAGRPYLELCGDRDARLTVGDFAEKKQREQDRLESLGAHRLSEIVAKLAAAFADEDTTERSREARLATAYERVRRDCPTVWSCYEAERAGRW